MTELPVVKTEIGLLWRCPGCNNMIRCEIVPCELSADEREYMGEQGITPYEISQMDLVRLPRTAQCRNCGFMARLKHPMDEETAFLHDDEDEEEIEDFEDE